MKNFRKGIVAILILALILTLSGCINKKPLVLKKSDTYIVISVSNRQMQITENTTLMDYMSLLKQEEKLDFEIKNGMISSVNGIENPTDWSSCWMLYTSDEQNANLAWGKVEYEGKLYGSAMFGAESLIVKESCLYIWVFQEMSVE